METIIVLVVAAVMAIAGLAIALVRGAALSARADQGGESRHPSEAAPAADSKRVVSSRGRSAAANVR